MECINCGKESRGRSKYCSDKCKVTYNRNKNRNTVTDNPPSVTVTADELVTETKPANYGQPDCQCMHCQSNRANGSRHTINHGAYKPADELGVKELNRVSLPGDVDYVEMASRKGVTDEGVTVSALPDCVPEPVRNRYARGEPDYGKAIDHLIDHTLGELRTDGTWIPVWRLNAQSVGRKASSPARNGLTPGLGRISRINENRA